MTRRLLAVLGAALTATLLWVLAVPVAGVTLTVHSGGSTLTVGPAAVVVVPLLAGLAALGLRVLLERHRVAWLVAALAVLAVSLLGPLGATSTGAAAVLAAMHLATAAVLLPNLWVRRRPVAPVPA
ncbi:DUF6069 family protein [Actinocatenispora rupis]|uniref:Uncharacterized protein n=1 Tax=Actinocatenispora rupis TaxID=519421 RepID=A0A8J3JB72_9ACTN|nr:DUF6069 family protein [Actinocatenispora rupis]GID15250.1 hypothetical protein Aru02nite_61390 [Actinocatenispora rupis]